MPKPQYALYFALPATDGGFEHWSDFCTKYNDGSTNAKTAVCFISLCTSHLLQRTEVLSIGATFVRSTTGATMPKPQYVFSSALRTYYNGGFEHWSDFCTKYNGSNNAKTVVVSLRTYYNGGFEHWSDFCTKYNWSTNAKTGVWF